MAKMATRRWDAEEKVAVVLSILRGELSISEPSRRHAVS